MTPEERVMSPLIKHGDFWLTQSVIDYINRRALWFWDEDHSTREIRYCMKMKAMNKHLTVVTNENN